ncbi:uncharacterized protein LOC144091242 isoform X2 [Stigmatopora argus]
MASSSHSSSGLAQQVTQDDNSANRFDKRHGRTCAHAWLWSKQLSRPVERQCEEALKLEQTHFEFMANKLHAFWCEYSYNTIWTPNLKS